MPTKIVSFKLNGKETEAMVKPMITLQSLLRDQLGFTATKEGCKQGGCGSCTVLVDGQSMVSCLLPVEEIVGREVTTLEGITPQEGLHPLQEEFLKNFAVQCGYCTPGMIVMAKALLDKIPDPTPQQIAEALSGNVCRCTGYEPIIQAVQDAAKRLNEIKGE